MTNKKNKSQKSEKSAGESAINKKNADKNLRLNLKSDVKRGIFIVLLVLLAILFTFGFFGAGGLVGNFLNKIAGTMFGWGKWFFPLALLSAGGILLQRKSFFAHTMKIIGLSVVFLSVLGFLHIFYNQSDFLSIAKSGQGGGYVGYILAKSLIVLTGKIAGVIVLMAFFSVGAMIAFNFSAVEVLIGFLRKKIKGNQKQEKEEGIEGAEEGGEKKGDIKNFAKSVLSKNKSENGGDKFGLDGDNEEKGKENDDENADTEAESNIKNIKFVEGPSDDKLSEKRDDPFAEYKKGDPSLQKRKKDDISVKKSVDQSARARLKSSKSIGGEWNLPPLELLNESDDKDVYSGNVEDNIKIIQETFANFGIELEDGGVKIGPTVTQYSFRPAVGVKLSRIVALGDDLALALAKHPIRIEAPIPGKSLIGIEVPNEKGIVVNLRRILEDDVFQKSKSGLTIALGKNVEGELIVGDLGEMPHLLIAGATGTGKSVCINSIILSLLFQNSPEDLKMILVDPKRVELSLYNKIPHLLSDVIVDNRKVINALKWAIREMEERYKILQSVGSRDLESYSIKVAQKVKRVVIDPDTGEEVQEDLKKMPYIVIIIDELADLMATHGKEVESSIIRLAQMARAVGIHLVISTQRPSVEILTGLIKANITTRIALQVATQIDSRTILDMRGAENLLGKGDMLFLSADSPRPKRIQSSFVSESEVKRVVKFIKEQAKNFELDENEEREDITENNKDDGSLMSEANVMKSAKPAFEKIDFSESQVEERDELYEEAKRFIIQSQKASASSLQRRFRIGYNRAARIIDELEESGVVGEADGQKAREVLIGGEATDNKGESKEINYDNPQQDQEKRDKWQV